MLKKIAVGAVALILLVVISVLGYLTLVPADTRLRTALGLAVPNGYAAVFEAVTPTTRHIVAQGKAAQEGTEAVTEQSRFRIASTSKTLVAVVLLQLAEEGVLVLDEGAAQWLPDEVTANVANADVVTIRQLMQMRSGVPEYLDEAFLKIVEADPFRERPYTPAEVVALVYGKPAVFEPGSQFLYTNTNYVLLQMVVEAATGNPLHEEVRARILDPVGMSNTYTQYHEELPGGFVHGYSGYKQDGSVVDVTGYNDGGGLGDGALVSTSGDLVRFYRALFREKTLLSEASLAEMLDFQDTGQPDSGYGLAMMELGTPWGTFHGHTGGVFGYGSVAFYHPERDVIMVILVATDTANALIALFGGLQAVLGLP